VVGKLYNSFKSIFRTPPARKITHSVMAEGTESFTPLNWEVVIKKGETRYQHIMKSHKFPSPDKPFTAVFNADPVQTIEAGWSKIQSAGIKPFLSEATVDHYVVQMPRCGREFSWLQTGEKTANEAIHGFVSPTNCDYLYISTQHGTRNLITSYPTSSANTAGLIWRK
jgi:hypothetical protein